MGVPMRKPPAKALPPFTEWQAMQSPARARYSPLSACVAVSCAFAAMLAPKTESATARSFIWLMTPPDEVGSHNSPTETPREVGIIRRDAPCSGRSERQIVVDDRQRADALAGRRKDRVRHRSGDRWSCGLAGAAPDFATARNEMDIDPRRLS